jgi:AcrR family transcriptional regulator
MDGARRSHGPVTREKLIEAAGEIFAEKGLHGASIRDITQRAGANIAAVNYHFHDKFELYALVLRQAHLSVVGALQKLPRTGTPEERVRQKIEAMLTTAFDPTRPPWHRKLLRRELVEPTPALDLLHDLVQNPAQDLWEACREIRPDLSEQQLMLAACGVISLCLFHAHHGHLLERMFPAVPGPNTATLITQVADFALGALRGLPAAAPRARRADRRGAATRRTAPAAPRATPRRKG